ncbi:hypothetical protein E4T56_gene16171 [Termitomyces sp. T112]|nr:hypothetical protein E4T56_gene16171 [Termitomyces sp. T112]
MQFLWYIPTTNDQECFYVLLQIHESGGHSPLDAAEWLHFVRASLAAAEEPLWVATSASAAPTEEGPLSSVAATTTNSALSSGASLENAPAEESMEFNYVDDSALTMNAQPVTTPPVVPSPREVVVVTNITTPTAPEAGTSGSSDTANAVLECWADIVSSKEVEASKMGKQAG